MLLEGLDTLLAEMIETEDASQLVVLNKKEVKVDAKRERYIAMLQIPTYEKGKRVMFYDVLLQLCLSCTFNHIIEPNSLQGRVFGNKNIPLKMA